jgi:CheY-like chemotaxis protein
MLERRVRVLVVDDEKDLLELMLQQFRAFGFEVRGVSSGAEAIEIIATGWPTFVVTDYRMSGVDGLQVLRACKDRSVLEPKVFVLTGFSDLDRAMLYHEGADGFFSKPFSASELRTNVQRCLLPKRQLWARSFDSDVICYRHNLASVGDLKTGQRLRLGRGGFCLEGAPKSWAQDALVQLDVGFVDKSHVDVSIQGRVLYVNEAGLRSAGVGITAVSSSGIDLLLALTGIVGLRPFVPAPGAR